MKWTGDCNLFVVVPLANDLFHSTIVFTVLSCSRYYPVHTFLYMCRFSSTNVTAFLFGNHILLSLQKTYPLCHSQTCLHHVVNRCLFWNHIKTLLQYNTHR